MKYPKYLSHKEVSAAKIAAVDHGADGSITVHLEGGFDNVTISHHERKHKPAPEKGWYLVQYSDGYISFSPAAAFEEGYALVADGGPDESLKETSESLTEPPIVGGTAKGDDEDEAEHRQQIDDAPTEAQTVTG